MLNPNPPIVEEGIPNAFGELIYDNATLYVPLGTTRLYKTSPVWKNFVNIKEILKINITKTNKWGTCVIPFDAELPVGVQAYTSNGMNGGFLMLEEAESLKAYTPYILYAENGYEVTLTGVVDVANYQETVTDGLLNGAIAEQQISAGYVLQNQGSGSMFYDVNGQTFTIPAGKCWLSAVASSVATVRISLDGTTGIDEINSNDGSIDEEFIYDLSGRQVENPVKGEIYIINGKKALKL